MEPLCSISVWASSLSAHSRTACWWALWGLWARGCPLFSGGSSVSSGPSGLGLQGHGAASQLRGAGLPQCPPAGRRCKRGKWGRSRRFLCPAERWLEVHLRDSGVGAGGESSMCKWRVFSLISFRWPRGWPSRMFFRVGGQFSCPCFFRRLSFFSWLVPGLIFMYLPRPYVFIPGLSLLSWSPCVCVPVSSSLWWLLQGRAVVWSRRGGCLQLCSSFSVFLAL